MCGSFCNHAAVIEQLTDMVQRWPVTMIVTVFQVIYMVFVYLGSVCSLELVWNLSDLCNACMAVPNLWCLWKLKELIVEKTRN